MFLTAQDVILHLEKAWDNPKALNYKNPSSGSWESLSTSECLRQIEYIIAALTAMGLKKGDKVAILSPPNPQWTLCDMGIMLKGCVCVPIFSEINEDHFVYQIEQSEAKVIFVAGKENHELCLKHASNLDHIISLDDRAHFKEELIYNEFIAMGKIYLDAHKKVVYSNDPEDLASIVYTSGTTTFPKGVELTHKNLFFQSEPSKKRMHWGGSNERYLNYLPLAHIFGRDMNLFMLASEGCIYYINDPSTIILACLEVKPTILILIPRTIEKIYNAIIQKIDEQKLKKPFTSWAFKRALLGSAIQVNQSWYSKFLNYLADKFLYSKIREWFGNSLRIVVTGSAKSNPTLLEFFYNLGITIIEGYGLTESCPTASNLLENIHFGSMGTPMPNTEIKITEKGEILIRGPTVMRGYYKNPNLTAKTIDEDKWLHTGDRGNIDEQGFMHFDSRVTEICKTSYGEFVNLPQLEVLLNKLPYVDSSLVIAENRPYVVSLFFINSDMLSTLKKRMALPDLSDEEILRIDLIKQDFENALEEMNRHLSPSERVRDYRFIYKKASVFDGELSPSMKQRRYFIESKYKNLINDMYPAHAMQIDQKG